MIVQVVSDLHIDCQTKRFDRLILPSAPILILAGDVCEVQSFSMFVEFIQYYSDKFEHIIHVLGNHEYYCRYPIITMEEVVSKFKSIKIENYHFLENDSFILGEYVFLGTTLWTKIDKVFEHTIQNYMSDYNFIYKSANENINPSDTTILHQIAADFIEKSIELYNDKKVILITHHKPIHTYDKRKQESAYQVDCEYLLRAPIILCVYGHTHEKYEEILPSGTLIVSNPHGYSHEKTNYENNKVIDLRE